MLMEIHALARVLANSEAFRVQREANRHHPIEQAPLDVLVTEELLAALYFFERAGFGCGRAGLERR